MLGGWADALLVTPVLVLDTNGRLLILKWMLNQSADIDSLLHALGDPTRRQIVERLGRGPASVSALAEPFFMSLPAIVQHLQVLERSGLVASSKVGRVRTCRLAPERLATVEDWIVDRRRTWERRLDRLGAVLSAETPPPHVQAKESTR